jgi:endonuclease-3
MSTSGDEKRKRASEILSILKNEYPNAGPLLHYSSPFQLLIATILAAQCTDERVNAVTPELFGRYPDPQALAAAELPEIEKIIRPTGFFKNKARSLKEASAAITGQYGGRFPDTLEELVKLPGVGRKTANVVVANCFGRPAVIVDTHVKRLSARLGLSSAKDPDKIEMELQELVDRPDRTRFSHVVNFHGRYVCQARKPRCGKCVIESLCPYPDKLF